MQIGNAIAKTLLGIALLPIRVLFGRPPRKKRPSPP